MRIIYLLIFILWTCGNTFAQLYSVSGKTLDENRQALPFVTLMILQAKDSSMVKAGFSDADGAFKLEDVPSGQFLVKTAFVGYETLWVPFSLDQTHLDLGALALNPVSTHLAEVTIKATKPLFQAEVDRIVVNVENSVLAAGKNTLEVLALSPGISLSPDESNLRLKGKGGVLVLIDGRQTYMSPADVIRFLKGLSASEVESIELISNPPSRYDAAGVAGIIHIKTIKNRSLGTKGSVNAGYRRGEYNHWNAGGSLATKTRSVSINNYASYADGASAKWLENKTQYLDAGEKTMLFDLDNQAKTLSRNIMLRNGINWDISRKWSVGSTLMYSDANDTEHARNLTDILHNPSGINHMRQLSDQYTRGRTFTATGYFKTIFKGTNHELSGDIDYSSFSRSSVAEINNQMFAQKSEPVAEQSFINSTPNTTHIRVGKMDYIKNMKAGVFEAGIKYSHVASANDARFEENIDNKWVTDPGRTFNFQYNENIAASYVSYALEKGKNSFKAGLRYERTFAEGISENANARFDKNYGQLFPTLFYQRTLNTHNQLGLSYSRRITRPNYASLNPFVYVLDSYTIHTGNPDLNPALSNSFEINHTYKYKIQTSLSYSRTKDNIHEMPQRSAENPEVMVYQDINIDHFDYYSLGVFFPVSVTKNWEMTHYMNVFYSRFSTRLNQQNEGTKAPGVSYNLSNNINLPKDFKLEAGWFFNGSTVYGLYTIGSFHGLSAGLKKSFNSDKTYLAFNFSDILFTNKLGVSSSLPEFIQSGKVWQDTRRFSVSLIHRFGKRTVQSGRNHESSSENERSRL